MRWMLLVALAACSAAAPPPAQPIAFDHSLHVRVKLDERTLTCTDCHAGATSAAHAGLPAITTCLRCHMRPQGDPPSAKERAVREAAIKGGAFRWVQITRNAGHVYFSHRAHTAIAKMDCRECHGEVAQWKAPPTEPNRALEDMGKCQACHRARGAPLDCGTCHQ